MMIGSRCGVSPDIGSDDLQHQWLNVIVCDSFDVSIPNLHQSMVGFIKDTSRHLQQCTHKIIILLHKSIG